MRGDRGHPVAQPRVHAQRIVNEMLRRVALGPAAELLQRVGQVPVVERQVGFDAARQQAIDEPLVVGQAGLVPRAPAVGLHARPGDRESVGVDAERRDQIQVLVQAMVVIARDIAVAAVGDRAGPPAESVPDRRSLAVVRGRPLDLERTGGHAPDEVVGKTAVRVDGQPGSVHATAPAVRAATAAIVAAATRLGIGGRGRNRGISIGRRASPQPAIDRDMKALSHSSDRDGLLSIEGKC